MTTIQPLSPEEFEKRFNPPSPADKVAKGFGALLAMFLVYFCLTGCVWIFTLMFSTSLSMWTDILHMKF